MLSEEHRIVFTGALEPFRSEAVTERLILVCEHLVRGVAHESMAKRVLALDREARHVAALDDLTSDQLVEPVVDLACLVLASHESQHTATPEDLSEDARGSKNAASLRIEPGKAGLDHCEHRARNRPLTSP